MNVRNVISLGAVLLLFPGLAAASVKNILSFKEGTNPKPTTIALTKYTKTSDVNVANSKLKTTTTVLPQVTFEFKPGKEVPAEFKQDGTMAELSVETDVNVPGQAKIAQVTTFTDVVITSVKVVGTGRDARETIEFHYGTSTTAKKA